MNNRGKKLSKQKIKSRKAISVIISTLMIMLIAVAAGAVIYTYSMGWIGNATKGQDTQGKLQYDTLYANATSKTIKMYVRNAGSKDLLLSKIYVDGNNIANATAISSSGVTLPVHAVAYLQVSYPAVTASYSYGVNVVCIDGTVVAQSVEAK